MELLHSGFDTIAFALQGALEPWAIEKLRMAKERAKKEDQDITITLDKTGRKVRVKKSWQQGGYAFVIDTGTLGEVISLKDNLIRDNWNGFVKISAESLAVHKRQKATNNALEAVSDIGFIITDVSYNRVDYCIDFLTDNLSLKIDNFVAHSRVKKSIYYRQEPPNCHQDNAHSYGYSDALSNNPIMPINGAYNGQNSPKHTQTVGGKETINNALRKRAVMRGRDIESVTLGTMPGRQVIIYDKKAQALAKRKKWWFDVWGYPEGYFRANPTVTVTRVEIRAGKTELAKYGIKSQKDLENHIGNVLQKIAEQIRYVVSNDTDTNISRQPLHPLSEWVQMHLKCKLEPMTSRIQPETVLNAIRAQKLREYESQIVGNMVGLAICPDIPIEKVIEELPKRIEAALIERSVGDDSPFWKTYNKAKDRLKF